MANDDADDPFDVPLSDLRTLGKKAHEPIDVPSAEEASPMPAPASHYRADVDGLRAVAVLSVVLFHLHPAALPGGFTGTSPALRTVTGG